MLTWRFMNTSGAADLWVRQLRLCSHSPEWAAHEANTLAAGANVHQHYSFGLRGRRDVARGRLNRGWGRTLLSSAVGTDVLYTFVYVQLWEAEQAEQCQQFQGCRPGTRCSYLGLFLLDIIPEQLRFPLTGVCVRACARNHPPRHKSNDFKIDFW